MPAMTVERASIETLNSFTPSLSPLFAFAVTVATVASSARVITSLSPSTTAAGLSLVHSIATSLYPAPSRVSAMTVSSAQ